MHRLAILTAAAVITLAAPRCSAGDREAHRAPTASTRPRSAASSAEPPRRPARRSPPSYRNFGACVSKHARDEASEREDAHDGASAACRAERGTTAQSRAAFEQKYGTNANKRNAFGKCVSQAAKAKRDQADAADRAAATKRKNAAKECARERGSTEASRAAFAAKYRTFGKCVSRAARA